MEFLLSEYRPDRHFGALFLRPENERPGGAPATGRPGCLPPAVVLGDRDEELRRSDPTPGTGVSAPILDAKKHLGAAVFEAQTRRRKGVKSDPFGDLATLPAATLPLRGLLTSFDF